MTANVSFMASGHGQVPWHRTNYVTVEGTMTSEEALHLAKLDFDVLQEFVYDRFGNQIHGYRLNYKSDDRTLLGLVSDRYRVVQNTEAFAFTDALIGDGCRYETAGALNGFRTIWLLATLEPRNIMGEQYDNYLCFMNSHDGSGAVKVCITPTRVVCQNTLNLALRTSKRTFSIRHVGDISNKIREANETLRLSEEYLTQVSEKYIELAQKKISKMMFDSLLTQLFPINEDDPNITKRRQQERRDLLTNCYEVDDLANFKGTAFGVLNAVSDITTHPQPVRMNDTIFGNLFVKTMEGHPMLDKAFAFVEAL